MPGPVEIGWSGALVSNRPRTPFEAGWKPTLHLILLIIIEI